MDARERRGDQHSQRERDQLDARGDRRVALRALVVEDEQEHQREARQPVDEGGGAGGGEQAVVEDLQVEHRRARAFLNCHPQRQQHDGREQAGDHDRVIPAAEPALGDAEHEAGQADHERARAEHVVAAHRVRFGELAQDQRAPGRAGERERHVEPEHPVPGDRDQRAAEHRAEHQPDRRDHRVGAHRQAEFLLRERVGDERRGVREQERRADPLQHPPEDQDGRVRGEAGAERGQREHDEAADVGALAPEQIAQASGRQHQHGRRDQIREDHPHQRQQARVQRALEVRQRDDQRPRVGRRQQHSQARARQRPPLVVGVAGGHAEARRTEPRPRVLCRRRRVH